MQIHLTLFGFYQLTLDGMPVKFATDYSRALLAYLAVEVRLHDRAALAALLWPEQPEANARQNLRQALHGLREALRPVPALDQILEITNKTVRLQPASIVVDVQTFQDLLATCAAHDHSSLATCPACAVRLQEATALYTAEFLHGFFIKNSSAFEEWAIYLREQLHRQALEALHQLTLYYENAANDEQVAHFASRQLMLEPWREEAHRQLMRALARSGQGTAAMAQYTKLQRVLHEELGLLPAPETTHLYSQIRSGSFDKQLAGAGQPTIPVARHNLPAALTPFVGRERELSEIRLRLENPTVRLLTLIGPGGMGKTRLAIEAVRQLVEVNETAISPPYPDGIFFVPLAALTPAAVAPAIASAMGLILHNSDVHQVLRQTLQTKQLLLILDNFEHLLARTLQVDQPTTAVELVLDLLQRAPALQMIVTSREQLNLLGEHLYPVQGLGNEQQGTLAEAMQSAALRLFVQSARRLQPHFKVQETNWPTLLHICELVQGMPLGIEMAAVWTNQLSPEEIAREIEQSIDFLAFEWHNVPLRQRSMRAVFDWSWRLLNETEQRVLGQLAVFRGGFTREAAEAIVGASLRVLTSLVNKSLVQRSQNTSEHPRTSQGRYELHELMRQFAQEQVAQEEWAKVASRHSEFYLAFLVDHESRLHTVPNTVTTKIQTELSNVRQAWLWAVHQRDQDRLARSAYSLWQFYLFGGLAAEGVQNFRLAADALQSADKSRLEAATDSDQQPEQRRAIASMLRAVEAHLLISQSHYVEATELAQQAIALGQPKTAGQALGYLVWAYTFYFRGQFAEARIYSEQALQQIVYDHPADSSTNLFYEVESIAYLVLGIIALRQDEYAEARRCFLQSLEICQAQGRHYAALNRRINLANVARVMCDQATARQGYEAAIKQSQALHYRWGEAAAQIELSDVVSREGEYTLALALLTRGLAILSELNDRRRATAAVTEFSRLYTMLGDYPQAQHWLDQALQLADELQVPELEEQVTFASALLLHALHQHERALHYATRGCWLAQASSDRFNQAKNLVLIGHAQAGLQQLDAAADAYQHAMRLYQELDIPSLTLEAQAGVVRMALAEGKLAQVQTLMASMLRTLADYPQAGLQSPFLIYLTCYHGLTAIQDPQAATVLQRGYQLLQRYAGQIADPALRHSFLENVAVHVELQALYAAQHQLANYEQIIKD